MNITYCC